MVHILDQISVRPGCIREFMQCFEAEYLPAAQQRKMALQLRSVSPPVELDEHISEVFLLWQITEIGDFWSMRKEAKIDPSVAEFWQHCEPWIDTRSRKVLSPYKG
jgi:hypothetical protein